MQLALGLIVRRYFRAGLWGNLKNRRHGRYLNDRERPPIHRFHLLGSCSKLDSSEAPFSFLERLVAHNKRATFLVFQNTFCVFIKDEICKSLILFIVYKRFFLPSHEPPSWDGWLVSGMSGYRDRFEQVIG